MNRHRWIMDSPTLLETHFDEFFLAVRRCLLRRVLDPELADELTAETFFRAARRVDQLPAEPQRIQMWLFRIATNVAISFFRKSSTTRAMLHRFSARSLAAATRRCDSAGDDEQACLRGLIRKLPPNYQSVVVLRYFARLLVRGDRHHRGVPQGGGAGAAQPGHQAHASPRGRIPSPRSLALTPDRTGVRSPSPS